MRNKGELATPEPQRWTRADDYLGALARRLRERRRRLEKPRTQPEMPRAMLNTIPFLALIIGLGILAVAIMIAAWPGKQHQPPKHPVAAEQGYAPKGWFQEAEKQFR